MNACREKKTNMKTNRWSIKEVGLMKYARNNYKPGTKQSLNSLRHKWTKNGTNIATKYSNESNETKVVLNRRNQFKCDLFKMTFWHRMHNIATIFLKKILCLHYESCGHIFWLDIITIQINLCTGVLIAR